MMQPLQSTDFQEGALLLFDKPYGWTSFDLVGKVRNLVTRKLGIKKLKVGHAGTLDPLATGLMIICTGKFTKRLQDFQALDKKYLAVFELGRTTPSYDLETAFNSQADYSGVDLKRVEQVLEKFTGEQDQIPPAYSAKFVQGDRAYEHARKGKPVHLEPSRITVHSLTLRSFRLPLLELEIHCSKGTYVRALARDMGQELGTGAYLKSLVRTAIGDYTLVQAWSIEQFNNMLLNI